MTADNIPKINPQEISPCAKACPFTQNKNKRIPHLKGTLIMIINLVSFLSHPLVKGNFLLFYILQIATEILYNASAMFNRS